LINSIVFVRKQGKRKSVEIVRRYGEGLKEVVGHTDSIVVQLYGCACMG
jgi:hypothetical protein